MSGRTASPDHWRVPEALASPTSRERARRRTCCSTSPATSRRSDRRRLPAPDPRGLRPAAAQAVGRPSACRRGPSFGAVRRLPIPAFLRDLGSPPGAPQILLLAMLSMAAAGVSPQVLSPAVSTVQAAIREQPKVNGLLLLVTLIGAAMLFVGGILGDTDGRRQILIASLAALLAASLFGLVVSSGPLFLASRVFAVAAAFAVVPFALALVATTYHGVVRATA